MGTMTDHEHEWGEPGKNEAGDLHDYAVCQICRRVMYRTEVYAILNEHAQLEAENAKHLDIILRLSKENFKHYLKGEVTTLENEVIRLEDEVDELEKKNMALMTLAGMYIKSYEELAFGDAIKEEVDDE